MHFHRRRSEEPEINLIPFIDVLLVVLIFLMLTTTYARYTELKIDLPTANADPQRDTPQQIVVAIASNGTYAINRKMLSGRSVEALASALQTEIAGNKNRVVVISADAAAAHQSVINVMDAARRVGVQQLTFATKNNSDASAPTR
jgi:biopolymer transport protein ExbD